MFLIKVELVRNTKTFKESHSIYFFLEFYFEHHHINVTQMGFTQLENNLDVTYLLIIKINAYSYQQCCQLFFPKYSQARSKNSQKIRQYEWKIAKVANDKNHQKGWIWTDFFLKWPILTKFCRKTSIKSKGRLKYWPFCKNLGFCLSTWEWKFCEFRSIPGAALQFRLSRVAWPRQERVFEHHFE